MPVGMLVHNVSSTFIEYFRFLESLLSSFDQLTLIVLPLSHTSIDLILCSPFQRRLVFNFVVAALLMDVYMIIVLVYALTVPRGKFNLLPKICINMYTRAEKG